MLKLDGVSTRYGQIQVLRKVSLEVRQGELVCLLGGNACGKSTTMKTILGLVRPFEGKVEFLGQRIDGRRPAEISRLGIVPVLEGRRIFPDLTVEENLRLSHYARRGSEPDLLARVYDLFPRLRERRRQVSGLMSGGEQQMLAIGRALMTEPRMLVLDEPSMGLAPAIIDLVFEAIVTLHRQGQSILLVEQNAEITLAICDYAYLMKRGEIVAQGTGAELRRDSGVLEAYLS